MIAVWMLRLAASGPAADWPRFLGPDANGTSPETGLIETFPASGPKVLWEKDVGTGYSAPSVLENKLVLFHRLRTDEIVECLDARTGQSLWTHRYPTHYTDPYGYNNGPRCTPLLTSNRCYTFGAEGKLTCLDLKSGSVIWTRDTARDWEIPEAFFGVGSTPVLENNLLLVMVGGQPNSGMVGLDAATGKTVWENVGETNWTGAPMTGWPGERKVEWRRFEKQASYATPIVANIRGRRTALCLMRQGLVALDPKTGLVDFNLWFRSRADDSVNAMSPVVLNDSIFISGAYYKVGSVFLKVNPDHKSFEELWRSTVLEIHWSTPILHDGYLYSFSGRNEPDARFRCVELKSGKLMWDRDESWPSHSTRTPPVYGRGSAILADGKLIVLGEGGLLGLFKVSPAAPIEICRAQIPQLHHPCWAGPVLSQQRLYLRDEDKLVCLDFSKNQGAP